MGANNNYKKSVKHQCFGQKFKKIQFIMTHSYTVLLYYFVKLVFYNIIHKFQCTL